MASQERLSVDAAAERLGITPDAVRSRIKRGTLWAVRRNGRVQVVLKDRAVRGPGGGPPPTRIPTNHFAPRGVAGEVPGDTPSDTALRLRAEVARQKHRVRALEAERDRLLRHLDTQHKFLDLECALRARLQDQIDRLCDRLGISPVGLFGLLILALGLMSMSFLGTDSGLSQIVLRIGLVGAGLGLFQASAFTLMLSSAPPERLSTASAALSLAQSSGTVMSVAVVGGIFALS
ncbi:MAG: hypothetical protein IIA68_13275, partial [Proteobacteria bacterium]|nr:hypothetical protein [Pseudomonadota bacterium]